MSERKGSAIPSKDLIEKIKPSLSDAPIFSVDMSMNIGDVAKVAVVYAVTDDLLRVLSTHENEKNI